MRQMADEDASSANQKLRYPDWQREFEAALAEVDPQKLPQRVKAAEGAIFLRQQALSDAPDHRAEQQAIADAMRKLRLIQTEKLGYPDWNKK